MYCQNCGKELAEGQAYCGSCGTRTGAGRIFCARCGQPVEAGDSFCTACGFAVNEENASGTRSAQEAPGAAEQKSPCSRLAAGLLGLFLGGLGIHNFYLGFTQKGVLQLVLTLVGSVLTFGLASTAVAIWGLIEGAMILSKREGYDKDAEGRPLSD